MSMNDLQKKFSELTADHSNMFQQSDYEGTTRNELMTAVPSHVRGVYFLMKKGVEQPLYIGSSGKIEQGMQLSGSHIRSRLFNSTTPYHFSDDMLQWGPTTATVPPDDYKHSMPLCDVVITIIPTGNRIAPAVLEHLLIQGFINEFGDLPECNQKI